MDAHELILEYERAKRDQEAVQALYEQRRQEILAKVGDELADLDVEMAPYLQGYVDIISDYEQLAREAVLAKGETVNGETTQFVYVKGKTTWDGQKLQGMLALIPQLEKAMKVGQPSVSVKKRE